jgi:murein tripeptide amidase MpaA
MKSLLVGLILIVLIAGGGYYLYTKQTAVTVERPPAEEPVVQEEATTTEEVAEDKTKTVLGQSAGGHDILAYHYGEGDKEVLLIGGIHGGYEWNTALVGFNAMDYFAQDPSAVPEGVKVTVIPVLNPDGLDTVVGTTTKFAAADVPKSETTQVSGRTNDNEVDLNRNFDCDWKEEGTWRNTKVSGGSAPFSEPESKAVQTYINAHKPAAVVVYFSAAGGVYSSNCHEGVLPETKALTNEYAKASGYPAHEEFDFYSVTGDITNWLAKEGIPAISVLLTNHTDVEWTKNQKGIQAVLAHFAE